jgi:hypothetical protein
MSAFGDKLHEVEINFPSKVGIEPEFFLKIDGKKIEGICGARVESRMMTGSAYPLVTINFWAKNVKGKIEGRVKEEKIVIKEMP